MNNLNFLHSGFINQIAENLLMHYNRKQTDDSDLRTIRNKITATKKQIDECTTAFIEAKSSTLRNNIEDRIASYEKLLDTLTIQKAQLESIKSAKMTKDEALAIAKNYLQFDKFDKKYQRFFIDVLVKKVIAFDDSLVLYFDLA